MEKDIPSEFWGWWIDVCPGKTLILRDAQINDIERCYLKVGSSKNPSDYYCELSANGSLVNKMAVQSFTELTS